MRKTGRQPCITDDCDSSVLTPGQSSSGCAHFWRSPQHPSLSWHGGVLARDTGKRCQQMALQNARHRPGRAARQRGDLPTGAGLEGDAWTARNTARRNVCGVGAGIALARQGSLPAVREFLAPCPAAASGTAEPSHAARAQFETPKWPWAGLKSSGKLPKQQLKGASKSEWGE